MIRRFRLVRTEDVNGKSGTGEVAEGVQFSDGVCAIRWLHSIASTAVFRSIDEIEFIHGHEGRTTVRFIDGVPV